MSNDLPEITEVDRGYYGGGDGKAINRHAWREFSVEGLTRVRFIIDRNLSMLKPYYEIHLVWLGARGIVAYLPHPVEEGSPWQSALPVLKEAIQKYAKEKLL